MKTALPYGKKDLIKIFHFNEISRFLLFPIIKINVKETNEPRTDKTYRASKPAIKSNC
jgi:hypothetical protein